MILLLMELSACGWKLPAEANEYYFQTAANMWTDNFASSIHKQPFLTLPFYNYCLGFASLYWQQFSPTLRFQCSIADFKCEVETVDVMRMYAVLGYVQSNNFAYHISHENLISFADWLFLPTLATSELFLLLHSAATEFLLTSWILEISAHNSR